MLTATQMQYIVVNTWYAYDDSHINNAIRRWMLDNAPELKC